MSKNYNANSNKVIVEYVDEKAILKQENRSAGYDVVACISKPITLRPLERALISTGIKMELPHNMECQVRPRSGNAFNHGITVLNTPGTIDEDYRGVVGVIIINLSNKKVTIHPCDKIAQLVFNKIRHPKFISDVIVEDTVRGNNGFGSTDK